MDMLERFGRLRLVKQADSKVKRSIYYVCQLPFNRGMEPTSCKESAKSSNFLSASSYLQSSIRHQITPSYPLSLYILRLSALASSCFNDPRLMAPCLLQPYCSIFHFPDLGHCAAIGDKACQPAVHCQPIPAAEIHSYQYSHIQKPSGIVLSTSRRTRPHTKNFSKHMACTASSAASCASAPAIFSWRDASATRERLSDLRAPALLKGTPFLGGKLAPSASGSKMRRTRGAALVARAQAVSTSAPKVGSVSRDVVHEVAGLNASSSVV
jgi:hypothetical protein